ncbi:hypothetical protein CY35_10G011300 [Sphagnum magellanicum]|nr:hypothetical protein CY35_10G011300 [Sphagnum magellanicum]
MEPNYIHSAIGSALLLAAGGLDRTRPVAIIAARRT